MNDILFLSNGHGEDMIATRIIAAIREREPALGIAAWPMVGTGDAYASAEVPTVAEGSRLPSEGFATVDPDLMLKDLRAGWIGSYLRMIGTARRLRGRQRLAVAIGDIVPLAAAWMSTARFAFVGCAKSAYYRSPGYRYNRLERALMRRAAAVFPRDELTARGLGAQGLSIRWRGNPMMDELDPSAAGERRSLVLLPGSRSDAQTNAATLLAFLGGLPGKIGDTPPPLMMPVAQDFDADRLSGELSALAPDWRVNDGREDAQTIRLSGPGGWSGEVRKGQFGETLSEAIIAVGMAGTANEQAIGMGVPLVAVPTKGAQASRYVAMKAEFFGPAALTVEADGDAVCGAVARLLGDAELRARMGAAGRERMGAPGASAAIADDLLALLGAA